MSSSKAKSAKSSSKRKSQSYDILSDEDTPARKTKKTKPATVAKSKGSKADAAAEPSWNLDQSSAGIKRAVISEFKGNTFVTIREYYENKNSGEFLPGKKGIMLNIEAYKALVKAVPAINKALKEKGIDAEGADHEEEEEEENAGGKVFTNKEVATKELKKKEGKKQGKKNIDATSDEEEEEDDEIEEEEDDEADD